MGLMKTSDGRVFHNGKSASENGVQDEGDNDLKEPVCQEHLVEVASRDARFGPRLLGRADRRWSVTQEPSSAPGLTRRASDDSQDAAGPQLQLPEINGRTNSEITKMAVDNVQGEDDKLEVQRDEGRLQGTLHVAGSAAATSG